MSEPWRLCYILCFRQLEASRACFPEEEGAAVVVHQSLAAAEEAEVEEAAW